MNTFTVWQLNPDDQRKELEYSGTDSYRITESGALEITQPGGVTLLPAGRWLQVVGSQPRND